MRKSLGGDPRVRWHRLGDPGPDPVRALRHFGFRLGHGLPRRRRRVGREPRLRASWRLWLVACALAGLSSVGLPGVGVGVVRADGAFPAPFRLFVPANRPGDITVTTNFGLITSRDGAKTWAWICEHGASDLGSLYQQAPNGGSGRILGIAKGALVFTDDDGCTWSAATGLPGTELVDDSFIDPGSPAHVIAIAHRGTGASAVFELFASSNAGASFSAVPLFATQPGFRLDGVEIARSNANRIYATTSPWTATANGSPPRILRSDDGGQSFTTLDAAPLTPGGTLGIAAVDPQNPDRLYLRSSDANDRLLVSNDGGRTLSVVLTADPGQQLSAFFRRADGTLFAAAFDSTTGTLFRSTDAGSSFQALSPSLHVGSIAERGGALYVLADGLDDPFLVGVSQDNGATFSSLVDYASVGGVRTCAADLRSMCAMSCLNLNNADVFAPAVCSTLVGAAPAATGDAATPGAARVSSGCGGCTVADQAPAPGSRAHRKSGRATEGLQALGSVLGAALLMALRRRRSCPRASARP